MNKAVIYTRVSSEEQIKGSSLEEQEKRCKYFIKSKDDDVVGVYQDGGRGGENTERPELQRLLEDAKQGMFDAVVVYKVDRLSRSLKDFIELKDYFTKLNIEITSVTEPFDTSTPHGILFMNMLGSFAEFEHSQIKERITMGQMAYVKKGFWKGNAPYGYDVVDKKLAINEKEAKVVKDIFKLLADSCYEQERLPLMRLQKIVSSWNVETKRANTKRKESSPTFWGASTLRNIIKNTVYTGKKYVWVITKNNNPNIKNKRVKRPKDEWVEIKVPQIVSEDIFDKAQLALKRNSEFAFRKGKGDEAMLSKIIYCSNCGRKYTSVKKGKNGKRIYYCQAKKAYRGGKKCEAGSFVDYRLEEPVWNKMQSFLKDPSLLEKYIKKQLQDNSSNEEYEEKYKGYEKRLKKIETKHERLLDIYLKGDIGRDKFKEQENELNKEGDEIRREMDKIKQSKQIIDRVRSKSLNFENLYSKLGTKLESIDYKTKTQIIRLLVDRVETNGKGMAKVHCILPKEVVLKTDQRVGVFTKPLSFTFRVSMKKHSHITKKNLYKVC